MYETIRRNDYWPNMASDVYITVSDCHSCAGRGTTPEHRHNLQLFPVTGPLEFVAINISGALLKVTKGNQHVVIITDRYSKLERVVPTARISTTAWACMFFDAWVFPYCIPSYCFTDTGTQFLSKLFGTMCTHPGTKHKRTTVYHPRTNG